MARKPKDTAPAVEPEVQIAEFDLFVPELVAAPLSEVSPEIVSAPAQVEPAVVEPTPKAQKPKVVHCVDCPKFTKPDKECELCWADKRSARGE